MSMLIILMLMMMMLMVMLMMMVMTRMLIMMLLMMMVMLMMLLMMIYMGGPPRPHPMLTASTSIPIHALASLATLGGGAGGGAAPPCTFAVKFSSAGDVPFSHTHTPRPSIRSQDVLRAEPFAFQLLLPALSVAMARLTPFEVGQIKAHTHHGLAARAIAQLVKKSDGVNVSVQGDLNAIENAWSLWRERLDATRPTRYEPREDFAPRTCWH